MYNEKVMDHFTNPRNMKELDAADGIGEVVSSHCGDMTRIYLQVEDGVIKDVSFKTFGCGAAIASASMATEMIKGKTLDEALALTNREVVNALGGLPEAKVHCSVLAEESIRAAIEDYKSKHCAQANA